MVDDDNLNMVLALCFLVTYLWWLNKQDVATRLFKDKLLIWVNNIYIGYLGKYKKSCACLQRASDFFGFKKNSLYISGVPTTAVRLYPTPTAEKGNPLFFSSFKPARNINRKLNR